MNVIIKPSNNPPKKNTVIINDTKNNNKKTLHFGDSRYSDYTKHKDTERKNHLYLGINIIILPIRTTQDFIRLIYFGINQHLKESIRDTNKIFNVNIKLK